MWPFKKMLIFFSDKKQQSSELYLQPIIALEVSFGDQWDVAVKTERERETIYFTPFGIQVAIFFTKILSPFLFLGCLFLQASLCNHFSFHCMSYNVILSCTVSLFCALNLSLRLTLYPL